MGKREPSPALIRLGQAIRRYREAMNLRQVELAKAIGYTDSWVSLVETGRHLPEEKIVERLEHTLQIPQGALMDLYRLVEEEAIPPWFRPWPPLEQQAGELRSLETMTIPGLLQTRAYATALLYGDESAVQARLKRQDILHREDEPPPTLHCLIDEGVLYRKIGSPEIMRDQLQHMIDIASNTIRVQVLPFGNHAGLNGAFVLNTMRKGGMVAYVDTAVEAFVTSRPEDISFLRKRWESLLSQALPVEMSQEVIRRIVEERYGARDRSMA